MLTSSGNQYLRPEYLNPIQGHSIELDAKKSPLALLAQTCSSIGADLSQKGSIPPVEKSSSKGKSSPGAKSPGAALTITPSDDTKTTTTSSFKPYEKKEDDDRVSPKRSSPSMRSPAGSQPSAERSSSRSSESGRSSSRPREPATSSASSLSPRVSSPITPKTSSSLSSHTFSGLCDLSKDPLAAYKLAPSLYPHLALSLDPLGAAGLSALTAKVPTSTSAALSSPYVGYARVKTASGSETVVPVCRDPYCTGCQINAHAAQVVNGTCPPGCTQCAQISSYTKSLASLPGLLPSLHASSLSGLYPPPGLVGGSHHPYVCNWIAGDTYCGKRFSTSEDLLQHLRTHTNLSTSESTLSLHALHHPLLAGHLPRGYPTPPLSPLSAARYHPYAKPALSHLPPTAPLPASALSTLTGLPPHPLSAYYNPYSLYARGLGATTGLH
ncbi:zinc finger protein Noc-like [Homarus americanus]|uniref:Zinc finger protein Noc-like 2 n=1 Tax=Homarus americanus TaxID=6706 RepID=A0A8J5N986_HOMAM|nr:zinc finger protein Noc-like [Homarus americanus]KAG7175840.1 Zinc finger protein Noc-like 2 [Homarus americanus]